MTSPEAVAEFIANNLAIAAPVAALFASWVLYGVLGKRYLGADDDFWPAIRNAVLPILHRLGMTSGLYAMHQQDQREFVGVVTMPEDEFERKLQAAGFYRNPLAAVKRSPQGWKSDGSWARRYGTIRWLGDALRAIPWTISGWPARMLGRFIQASGDIFARRQLHVTIYTQQAVDGKSSHIHLYAHDEPNSLNPLTAFRHYLGTTWSPKKGVAKTRAMLHKQGIFYSIPSS